MAIEQHSPEVPRVDRINLDAPTETELCTKGAVKLTHMELASLRDNHREVLEQLQIERQRCETLTIREASLVADRRILQAAMELATRKEIIVRLIEIVIIILAEFVIEDVRAANWPSAIACGLSGLVLIIVICMIQWWPRTAGGTKDAR